MYILQSHTERPAAREGRGKYRGLGTATFGDRERERDPNELQTVGRWLAPRRAGTQHASRKFKPCSNSSLPVLVLVLVLVDAEVKGKERKRKEGKGRGLRRPPGPGRSRKPQPRTGTQRLTKGTRSRRLPTRDPECGAAANGEWRMVSGE